MYDLGNLAFIRRYFLYDQRARIGVEVTADIDPAPSYRLQKWGDRWRTKS